MIDKITSSIGSSLLFQAIKQNLDDYQQGANRLARVVYQSALAIATSSSMRSALRGVQCLSTTSQNIVQGTLITALAAPIILNLSDLFALPVAETYRREIFAMNSNFSSVCYTIMSLAIAIFSCSSGVTMGIVALGALHAQPIIERLGLSQDLTSILSISNKLLGGVYGLCSGSYVIMSLSLFQTVRNIEKLSMLYIQNKEEEIKSMENLQNLPRKMVHALSTDKTTPAKYHLIRQDLITVPPLPEGKISNLSEMLSTVSWKENNRAKEELARRLAKDSIWTDRWGSSFNISKAIEAIRTDTFSDYIATCSSQLQDEAKQISIELNKKPLEEQVPYFIDRVFDIDKAIEHIYTGAKNFSKYMETCPDEMRRRAMWVLINLEKKSVDDQIPYLIEMALHMHYCKEGKNAEIESTYGILFNQINSTSVSSKIHQIIQYKREELFKSICHEEVSQIYSSLENKVRSSQEEMKVYEPVSSDTLTERVQKCLYYVDSYFAHQIWKFRSFLVEKFKEQYMNDVHVYNALKKELTNAMRDRKTPSGFLLTRLIHWMVIKIHEFILSPEVMNIRIESLNRMCKEYNTEFILQQLQDSLENDQTLHSIDHQHVLDWLQSDLEIEDLASVYEGDVIDTPAAKIKDNHLLYLLVRIGLLDVSKECRATFSCEEAI